MKALVAAKAINSKNYRFVALAALAPNFSAEQKNEELSGALFAPPRRSKTKETALEH